MATVGQTLTAPEAGWKRYDDNDLNISYTTAWKTVNNSSCYHGQCHQIVYMTAGTIESAAFNFVGTKIRFISYISPAYIERCYISIDGIEYSYAIRGSDTAQALVFEMAELPLKEHTVQIYQKDVNTAYYCLVFDAIDIDVTGTLKPHNPNPTPVVPVPTNLTATAGDTKITLSWDSVSGATGYNVKRSTVSGGSYTTIASNITGTTYNDTSVTNGTTYYYVVTAVNADGESSNSNEASATPMAEPVEDGQALLRVTMLDSSEREYQLPRSEINGFINWYTRTVGTGTTCYMLTKSIGLQNSKEYLAFDKIISFEVIAFIQ